MAARVVPFGLYLLFLLVSQAVGWLAQANGWQPSLTESLQLWIYPVKTLAVVAALLYYWHQYDELRWPPKLSFSSLMLAVGTGVLVYLAWVRMELVMGHARRAVLRLQSVHPTRWSWVCLGRVSDLRSRDRRPDYGRALLAVLSDALSDLISVRDSPAWSSNPHVIRTCRGAIWSRARSLACRDDGRDCLWPLTRAHSQSLDLCDRAWHHQLGLGSSCLSDA